MEKAQNMQKRWKWYWPINSIDVRFVSPLGVSWTVCKLFFSKITWPFPQKSLLTNYIRKFLKDFSINTFQAHIK